MEKIINDNGFVLQHKPPLAKLYMESLEERVQKLSDICDQLNPYTQIPQNLIEDLQEFSINDLSDPFIVTNKLLVLLEDAIDELHSLKHDN